MITVAIVDDEKRERDLLQKFFQKLAREVSEEVKLISCVSGEELLEKYNYSFDLICLDIDMPGLNGIETARKIRKKDEQVIIIFVTNMAQMAIQGYEVRALDFVIKPLHYYSFALKLRSAFQMINNRENRSIVLNTTSGIKKINTDDVYYVEVQRHHLYYHTSKGMFQQKTSLKDLEERLVGLSFKRCNNCYLINLKHVTGVDKDEVEIAGEKLKMSRPRKKEFLQTLAKYMGGIEI